MIKWDPTTRSLTFSLPHWTELLAGRYRRHTLIVAFILVADILVSYVDRPLADYMRQIDPRYFDFFYSITKFGDSRYTLIPIALILPFLLAIRQGIEATSLRRIIGWLTGALVFMFIAVASSGILVNIIKVVVGRTRPILDEQYGEYGFSPFTYDLSSYQSFPAAHSTTAFVLAIGLSFFLPRLRVLLLLGAGLVAFSLLATNRHYLTDVLCGGLLGLWIPYRLRAWFAEQGWVFIKRQGEYRVAAPGQILGSLMGNKLRAWLSQRLGG